MTSKEFSYECSKCGSKITLAGNMEKPEKQFCGTCGNELTFISENSPFEEIEEKEETEIKFDFGDKPKLDTSNLDKLPKGLVLKENQNPKCNAEGHFCAFFNNEEACLKPINEKEERGEAIFEVTPCERNPKKGFEIKEIG